MIVVGIDPGTTESAVVVYTDGVVTYSVQASNDVIVQALGPSVDDDFLMPPATKQIHDDLILPLCIASGPRLMAIEWIESFGMAVGREVFETCYWVGRFVQAFDWESVLVTRRQVKLHLCGNVLAKDKNITQALKDRFGGHRAVGTKKAPGPLFGISQHKWSALAVAVTYYDTRAEYRLESSSAATKEF